MTSRQSEWCKPGDAQGNSIPGWGINQVCGHGQVIFPQWGGIPGWAGLLYGRPQAECPADLQPSASCPLLSTISLLWVLHLNKWQLSPDVLEW